MLWILTPLALEKKQMELCSDKKKPSICFWPFKNFILWIQKVFFGN